MRTIFLFTWYISIIITLTDMELLYDYTNHVIMLLCWWVVWLKDNKELELELEQMTYMYTGAATTKG